MSSVRGTTVMSASTRKRPSALLTSAVEDGFWGGRSPSQKATGTARRQARRARQEPDAQTFGREITVFPALAQAYTKKDKRPDAEAFFGESVAEVADSCREERRDERKEADASDTVSPCPPAEDLKDFLSSKKTFKSGEEKAGSIDNIGFSRYLAYGRLL